MHDPHDQFARDIQHIPPIDLHLEPITAWALFGAIQLACQHPDVGPTVKKMLTSIAQELERTVSATPFLHAVAASGWTPDTDPDDPDAAVATLYRHIASLNTASPTELLAHQYRTLDSFVEDLLPPGIPTDHPVAQETVREIRQQIADELTRRGEPLPSIDDQP